MSLAHKFRFNAHFGCDLPRYYLYYMFYILYRYIWSQVILIGVFYEVLLLMNFI